MVSTNKVDQTSATREYAASLNVNQKPNLMILCLALNKLKSLTQRWYYLHVTEYTPTITAKLDTRATCSVMSGTDLLNILQMKMRLYNGCLLEPLGSYTPLH